MGDGITDLPRRGLPGSPGARMDGKCDHCGQPLPEFGVVWAGPEMARFKWHKDCAPEWLVATLLKSKEGK